MFSSDSDPTGGALGIAGTVAADIVIDESELGRATDGDRGVLRGVELGQQELGAAGQLIALVRSLIADVRRLRELELPLAEWMEIAAQLVTVYLEPDDDDDLNH